MKIEALPDYWRKLTAMFNRCADDLETALIRQKNSGEEAKELIKRIDQHLKDKSVKINALQAKIDQLMFEYCPEEMTERQKENWGKHQKPVTAEQQAELEESLK